MGSAQPKISGCNLVETPLAVAPESWGSCAPPNQVAVAECSKMSAPSTSTFNHGQVPSPSSWLPFIISLIPFTTRDYNRVGFPRPYLSCSSLLGWRLVDKSTNRNYRCQRQLTYHYWPSRNCIAS